jgi:preprotein translocase subunit SecA
MDRLKMPEGEPIEAGIVTRSIESAQRKVEARNFDIRKQLLEYDDVANDQRKVIYTQRNELLEAVDIAELVASLRVGVFTDVVRTFVPAESVEEQWDIPALEQTLASEWSLNVPLSQMLQDDPSLNDDDVLERVLAAADESYNAKIEVVGKEAFGGFERNVMLQSVDTHWREHLAALDHLRQGIHLRGYAQKNPKQEYKREAFELFGSMLDMIKNEVIRMVMTVRIQTREEVEAAEAAVAAQAAHLENINYQHADFNPSAAPEELLAPTSAPAAQAAGEDPNSYMGMKVGRNDPCPCGSGKKFKQCHGKLA